MISYPMNDPATLSDDPPPMNLSVEAHPGPDEVDLEKRVQHLEDEVTALKDTKALEERVVERVTERLQKTMGSEQFTASPARAALPPSVETRASRGRYSWLFFDMFTDARLILLMLFDRRYAVAWTTHLVIWLFIPAILTSGWWFWPFAYIPFLGHYLDKVLDLLLAFGVYKALSREARRYREVLDQRR